MALAAQWPSPEAPDDIWVVSGVGGSTLEGFLYKTEDGGKTWQALLGAPAWPVASQSAAPSPTAGLPDVHGGQTPKS